MPARATIDYSKPFVGARWFAVLPRAAACPDLPPQVLLHAGPPYRGEPPEPVLNAAVQALLHEKMASGPAAARDLLLSRSVELQPAQDHGVVTPLAQVVSASMPLAAVRQENHVAYAPLVEGPAPALRFGCTSPDCLRRLQELSAQIDRAVAPLLRREPPAIDEVVRRAVAAGDECHARTAAANEALISMLSGLDAGATALRSNPTFVLPILIAAAAAALRTHGSDIEAIGGNGIDFGVRRRGERTWRQLPAEAPRGTRLAGLEAASPLGAIGDSAVIDFCGLGGQALAAAPLLADEWRDALPADALEGVRDLIDPHSGIVDAGRIVRMARAPLINLAILDRAGVGGLIGRGFYSPAVSLFS